MKYELVIFGVKDTSEVIIEYLSCMIRKVNLVITIDNKVLEQNHVSGYSELDRVADKYGIDLYKVSSYSLNDENTQKFFAENEFDIGISMGWQRLIPKYVLERFRYGIFGFHGSCGYLPYGRGRSPLNWSIINGDKRFILNLFQYDENADSPNVFSNRMFQISEYDTIRTLQYKNILCAKEQCKELLEAYRDNNIKIKTETRDFDFWYEKRTPKDGKLDFKKKTSELCNLIRGVTKPFPGAYSQCNGQKVIIWEAVPFDNIMDFSGFYPGQVIDVFDGCPIIRTVDGSILIKHYESNVMLKSYDILEGIPLKRTDGS